MPWAPGPVTRQAPASDVDVVLDELFGPADDGGPGWLDAALVVLGVVLLVRGTVVGGVLALVLGLALPLRSVARRARRASRRRRYAALAGSGSPLASGSPATAELLAAYESVLALAGPHGAAGEEAVAAAHRAVVECASLLGGRVPSTREETAYVARRTAAIRSVAAALRAAPDREERVAAVRAREEVDALTAAAVGTALDDLAAVVRGLSR